MYTTENDSIQLLLACYKTNITLELHCKGCTPKLTYYLYIHNVHVYAELYMYKGGCFRRSSAVVEERYVHNDEGLTDLMDRLTVFPCVCSGP